MKKLKALSKKIGDFQSFLILSIIFFIFVPIFSAIFKKKDKKEKLSWDKWSMPSDRIDQLRKQY